MTERRSELLDWHSAYINSLASGKSSYEIELEIRDTIIEIRKKVSELANNKLNKEQRACITGLIGGMRSRLNNLEMARHIAEKREDAERIAWVSGGRIKKLQISRSAIEWLINNNKPAAGNLRQPIEDEAEQRFTERIDRRRLR